MGVFSTLVVTFLVASTSALPQISPNADTSSPTAANPAAASPALTSPSVSPWSQWMSLKAPPITQVLPGGGKSKKKKLLPGPAPPEGIPEAPWVSWTRMKVSSALGSPAPGSSSSPPDSSSVTDSSEEPSILIQWTQVKLPLNNPSESTEEQSTAPETPWDAWTKTKISSIPGAQPVPASSSQPTLTKRMAPDRYSIASTVAPRFSGVPSWQLAQQEQGSDSLSNSGSSSSALYPTQQLNRPPVPYSSVQGGQSSTQQNYLNLLGMTDSSPDARLPFAPIQPNMVTPGQLLPVPFGTQETQNAYFPISPEPGLQASLNRHSIVPTVQIPVGNVFSPPSVANPLIHLSSPAKSTPSSVLTTILKPIPHQIVSEILTKGTPQEITQIVQTLAALDDSHVDEKSLALNIQVGQLLPPSLIERIPDVLTPLLSSPLEIPAPEPIPVESLSPISIIPEPIRSEILAKASPSELASIESVLKKLEALPPAQQSSVASLDVASILPPSLITKISPTEVGPQLGNTKLIPPLTAKLVPPPVLEHIIAAASPSEVASITNSIATIETESSPILPPIKSIIPTTLLPKLPPQLTPLLLQPLLSTPLTPHVPTSSLLASALPPPLYSEIVEKASPEEIVDIRDIIALLEAAIPTIVSPPVNAILPPSLIPKLEPAIKPLLEKPLILPKTSPLTVIPPAVLKPLLEVAAPEEIPEIIEKIAIVKDETVIPPVSAILPTTVIAKLPQKALPLLSTPLSVPISEPSTLPLPPDVAAKLSSLPPPVVSTIVSGLSTAPPTVLKAVLTTATPTELETLSETLTKLEATPPELKPVVEQLELATILPETLVSKLPPTILPLLSEPLTVPSVDSTPISVKAPLAFPPPLVPVPPAVVTPPVSIANPLAPLPKIGEPLLTKPSVPSPILSKIVPVLSSAPKPLLPLVFSIAKPAELKELAETITNLEKLSPEEKALLPPLPLKTILPASIIPRLPFQISPVLESPIVLPVPPEAEKNAKLPYVPTPILSTVIPVLALAQQPVLPSVLSVAAPVELKQLSETITKLETASPEQKEDIAKLELQTILPQSLVAKLPPQILPLLSTPLILPSSLLSPPAALTPTIASPLEPLKLIPEPILSTIVSIATPVELNELTDILEKVETVSPEEKKLISEIPLASILPRTILLKLPPNIVPLLNETKLELPPAPPLSPATKPISTIPLTPETVAPIAPEPLPSSPIEEKVTPAEKKLLTKWAKVILTKTGKPVPPVPGEIPPLQAAWMEWVQLKMNKTLPNPPPTLQIPSEATEKAATEYPWTKWLKLKNDTVGVVPSPSPAAAIEPLSAQIQPEMPTVPVAPTETELANLLASLKKIKPLATPPPVVPVSPITEEVVADILKKLGVETVNLPPDQITALLAEVEKEVAAQLSLLKPPIPSMSTLPELHAPSIPSEPKPAEASLASLSPLVSALPKPDTLPNPPLYPIPFLPYTPEKPIYPPFWLPPTLIQQPVYPYPAPASPLLPTLQPEEVKQELSSSLAPSEPIYLTPTINLTQYLIENKLIPSETPPNAPIPIPTLAKILEEHVVASPEISSEENPVPAINNATEHQITANELAALTPTKFAALLKQILKDCNKTNELVPRSLGAPSIPLWNKGAYYKNKYAGWKKPRVVGGWGSKNVKRALYPIPSQGVAQSTSTPQPVESLLPLPKVDTSGTVLDPAYWAAQKSMFLSKLFSTLAKVALNETSTPSPKEQLAKQANTVLMSGMTRSIKHHPHHSPLPLQEQSGGDDEYEDEGNDSQADNEEEYEESSENEVEDGSGVKKDVKVQKKLKEPGSAGVNENELVNNDNSEPNLPKEPDNPLHKLFKFGVQKTVLSDLSTPAPQQPYYVYVTQPPATSPQFLQHPTAPTLEKQTEMVNKLKNVYKGNESKIKKKKKQKSHKSHKNHEQSHHHSKVSSQNSKKVTRFRGSTTTTTENPVDFELLAKALLMDNNGAKRSTQK